MITGTDTSYRDALKRAGYPTDVVTIDFETFYDGTYGLGKMSVIEYVKDSRFEMLGVAVHESHGSTLEWSTTPGVFNDLLERYGPSLAECTILAQNSRFDLCVLLEKYNILPRYHVDLMALSRHVHPQCKAGLKDMAALYGLKPKGDTADFKGATRRTDRWARKGGRTKAKDMPVRLPVMGYEKEADLKAYALHDAELEFELFTRMLPRFSRPEVELPLQQHTTEQFLTSLIKIDIPRARRIRKDMLHEVEMAAAASGFSPEAISGNTSFQRILTAALAEVGETLSLKENAAGKMIPAVAKTDASYDKLLEHWYPPVAAIMAARVAIKSWPTKAKRVGNLIKQCEANDGVLPVPLQYHGAHTGRWSGSEGINLQNLGAHGHPLDAEVRNVLLPPSGHKLVIVDQASVEARGTAWLAGEHKLLGQFENGEDSYVEFANNIFPYPVRKARPTDPAPVAALLKNARACGKIGVLGGGYGMGANRCREFAGTFGVTLTFQEAADIINTYRSTFPNIVRFWTDIYKAFKWTYKTNRESTVGPIRLYADITQESEDVVIVLPSGRELRYANVAEQMGDRGPELICYSNRSKKWSKIYGGYLTENIVQALCRDTLADVILKLESEGIRIPLTVHDEIVAVAVNEDADRVLARILEVMRESPAWASDLPLDAEGHIAEYYGK